MSLTSQQQQREQQQYHAMNQPASSNNLTNGIPSSVASLDANSLMQLQEAINQQLQQRQQQQQQQQQAPMHEQPQLLVNTKRPRIEEGNDQDNLRVLHHEMSPSVRDPRRGIVFTL